MKIMRQGFVTDFAYNVSVLLKLFTAKDLAAPLRPLPADVRNRLSGGIFRRTIF